jgi:SM-20-related protein
VPLTRQISIGKENVYVLDQELPDAVVKQLYAELSTDRSYTRTEFARAERIQIKHWATEFDVGQFIATEMGRRTVDLVAQYYPGEQQKPVRAYCNVASYGDMLSVHRDCTASEGDVTALWFVCDEWEQDWRGELLLFDHTYDAQCAVTPRIGRLCLFRGLVPHVGTPPSRLCYKPRLTLACKFVPTDEPKVQTRTSNGTFESVAAVFEHVQRRLRLRGTTKGVTASYKFVITGDGGGTWLVNLTKEGGSVRAEDGEGDLTVTVAADTFLDAVNGKINVAKAFLLRKIRASGNLDLVIHLRDLLGFSEDERYQ